MSDLLLDRLDAVRGRLRRVHLLAGLCKSLLAFLGLVAAFFLLDWLVLSRSVDAGLLDIGIRSVLVLAVLGITWLVVWRTIVAELRTERSDDEIALRIERKHPKLRGRLISTVQLTRSEQDDGSLVSQEMIDALAEETVSFADALDFGAIINRRTLTRFGIAALVVVVLSGGLGSWRKDYARALAGRLLLQRTDYPTAARIISVTPGTTIGRGDDFEIDVAVDGSRQVPDVASALLRTPGSRATALELARVPGGGAVVHFKGVIAKAVDDFSFRPVVYDARWPTWEQVTVRQRPGLKTLTLLEHFPRYLKQGDETSAIGDIRAPVGTVVEIKAQLTVPVVAASCEQKLLVHDADGKPGEQASAVPMAIDAGGQSATLKLTISESGSWSLVLKDADGFTNPDTISYTIAAIPDRPPTVSIRTPAADKEVSKYAKWPITFTARDDHAVAKAWLRWTVSTPDTDSSDVAPTPQTQATQDAQAKSQPIDLGADELSQVAGRLVFDLSTSGAVEGQRVTYWIDVADNHEPDPNHATSARYMFTVLDAEAIREKLEHERADLFKQTGVLRKRQEADRTTLQAVQNQLP